MASGTAQQRAVSSGWPVFLTILFGQIVSQLGSDLTSFALNLWVYQETGSASVFALMIFFTLTPGLVLGTFAGALVDRWNRRWVLVLSDTGAALVTLGVLIAFNYGVAQVWHLYIAVALSSILGAFQMPAYKASVTLLVPPDDYARASGLTDIGVGIVKVGAPALAGLLFGIIGVNGIITIDLITFFFAVFTLLVIRIPQPATRTTDESEGGSLFAEALFGWRYILARPGFVGLVVFVALNNFLQGLVLSVFIPMLLSFTSERVAGQVISIALSGLIVGGLAMLVWGGPKRRIHGVIFSTALIGGSMIVGGLRPSVPLITAAGFVYWLLDPVFYGCIDAIWLSRVPADIQGRVLSADRILTWSTLPVAFLLAGVFADGIFGPLFARSGPLTGTLLGRIFDLGPGRGIGFMLSAAGLLLVIASIGAFMFPRLRLLEDEIPAVEQQGTEETDAG